MSTLYIRVPSKAAADSVPHWITLPCPFAVTARGDAIEREGAAPLADLSDTIGKAQRVVLMLAASDVTVLRVQVPPLSPAKLRAALPNMIEDQLMSDPSECALALGPADDGMRTVAVVSRGWLNILADTVASFGADNIVAMPSQLCLPHQSGVASAVVSHHEAGIELMVRLSEHEGLGLPLLPEQPEAPFAEIVQTLCMLVPEAPVNLYVPQAEVPAYKETAETLLALDQRVTVHADNWSRWIAGAAGTTVDLLSERKSASASTFDWKPWRWPLALAAAVLIINIIGLNIEWWRLKSEEAALRNGMMQAYKSAFPNDKVVLDPVGQMKQKIAAAQRQAGQFAADDFLALASYFSEAWQRIATPGSKLTIASVEYHEGSLHVKIKGGGVPVDALKSGLDGHNLSVSQQGGVLVIRSRK